MISKKLQNNPNEITFSDGCCPVSLQHIFRTPFPKNTSGSYFCKPSFKRGLLKLLLIILTVMLARWMVSSKHIHIAALVLHQIQNSNVCPNEPIPRLKKQLLNADLLDFAGAQYKGPKKALMPQMLRYQYVWSLKVLTMAAVWPKIGSEFDLQFLREIIICPETSEYYGCIYAHEIAEPL